MGMRVGLTFRFSALFPLNCLRVQNLAASSPSVIPSVVSARMENLRQATASLDLPENVCTLATGRATFTSCLPNFWW